MARVPDIPDRYDFLNEENIKAPEPVYEKTFKKFCSDKGVNETANFIGYLKKIMSANQIKDVFCSYRTVLRLHHNYRAELTRKAREQSLGNRKVPYTVDDYKDIDLDIEDMMAPKPKRP